MGNPLRSGDPRLPSVPPACAVVIFGATGDLASRKLIPALYNLHVRRLLPAGTVIVGLGRRDLGGDAGFAQAMREKCEEHSRTAVTDADWQSFAVLLRFLAGDFNDPALYTTLKGRLDAEHTTGGNALYYLSVPPSAFPTIVEQLAAHDLSQDTQDRFSRVIIEKPFGRDLASAQELNRVVNHAFDEDQVFRIDHYLGKESVQNILVMRFANGIFEPVWNRNFIDHVQVTVSEAIGVESRGRFYEEAGALRDIVQNHMLQVLSFVAMEPPTSFEASAVRSERAKLLHAVRPLGPADVVRGQYAAGYADGASVPGYREEQDVSPTSEVETYLAARLAIDNWRWAGTPFYLRTGKRLPKRVTEVAIQFKRVPHLPFSYAAAEQLEANTLVMRIQPDEGIALRFGAKVPAPRVVIRNVQMDFEYDTSFQEAPAEAYETLLLDAMRGDATNFPREDAVDASWRIVEPVLDAWQHDGGATHLYESGTWGPEAADQLLANDGRRWRRP